MVVAVVEHEMDYDGLLSIRRHIVWRWLGRSWRRLAGRTTTAEGDE